jgi:hypothetical protein
MLADGISRAFEEMSPAEVQEWIPQVDEKDDFLFTISQNRPANDEIRLSDRDHLDDSTYRTNRTVPTDYAPSNQGWVSYSIRFQPAILKNGQATELTNTERREATADSCSTQTVSRTVKQIPPTADLHCTAQQNSMSNMSSVTTAHGSS